MTNITDPIDVEPPSYDPIEPPSPYPPSYDDRDTDEEPPSYSSIFNNKGL